MPNKWTVCGYVGFEPTDLLVLPVFSRANDGAKFSQFTFSDASPYFELMPFQAEQSIRPFLAQNVYPDRERYYGLKVRDRVEVIPKEKIQEALAEIEYTKLSDPAKVQYLSLTESFDNYQSKTLPKGVVGSSDFSFFPTLSAQTFSDHAIASIRSDADHFGTIRKVLHCSQWATGWNIGAIPRSKLDALLPDLNISEAELDKALRAALSAYELSLEQPVDTISSGDTTFALSAISRLKRQELRISQILRLILLDAREGLIIAENYSPKTKYEALIMPMVIETATNSIRGDGVERELRVAQLIPKIYRKYFPIRRGRFLVDFIRVLGDFRRVREQIVSVFEERKNTYGVGLYADVIRHLIENDDDAARQMRREIEGYMTGESMDNPNGYEADIVD